MEVIEKVRFIKAKLADPLIFALPEDLKVGEWRWPIKMHELYGLY